MKRFEYKIHITGEQKDVGPLIEATVKLQMLGREGWELVSVNGTDPLTLFLKRVKQ